MSLDANTKTDGVAEEHVRRIMEMVVWCDAHNRTKQLEPRGEVNDPSER